MRVMMHPCLSIIFKQYYYYQDLIAECWMRLDLHKFVCEDYVHMCIKALFKWLDRTTTFLPDHVLHFFEATNFSMKVVVWLFLYQVLKTIFEGFLCPGAPHTNCRASTGFIQETRQEESCFWMGSFQQQNPIWSLWEEDWQYGSRFWGIFQSKLHYNVPINMLPEKVLNKMYQSLAENFLQTQNYMSSLNCQGFIHCNDLCTISVSENFPET